jgi:hypothetical protein
LRNRLFFNLFDQCVLQYSEGKIMANSFIGVTPYPDSESESEQDSTSERNKKRDIVLEDKPDPVVVRPRSRPRPSEYKAYFVGAIASTALNLAAAYFSQVKKAVSFIPTLFLDTAHTALPSATIRLTGEMYKKEGNRFERFALQPAIHILVAGALAYEYRGVLAWMGGDVDDKRMIPATVFVEVCAAPIEEAVERYYFSAKHMFFKCIDACKELGEYTPDPIDLKYGPEELERIEGYRKLDGIGPN